MALSAIVQTACGALDRNGAVCLPAAQAPAGTVKACVAGTFYRLAYGGLETHYYTGEGFGEWFDPSAAAAQASGSGGGTQATVVAAGTAAAEPVLFASSSGGSLSLPKITLTGFDLTVHSYQLDYNEFGLVDWVCTAEGEKNPWGSGGVTYSGGKTRERYVFVNNSNNSGYWKGTSDTTVVTVRGFARMSEAASAASDAVARKSANQTVENHISKHGRWYVLTTHVTTRK